MISKQGNTIGIGEYPQGVYLHFDSPDDVTKFVSNLAVQLAERNAGMLRVPKLTAEQCAEDRGLDKTIGDTDIIGAYVEAKGR
jgi:hypothetical protein